MSGSGGRVLVAGVGNVFLGDDGFGVAVAERLAKQPVPDGVRVADFGIRGVDLAYELMEGYDLAILVDAVPRGGEPGTIYVIEPQAPPRDAEDAGPPPVMDGHGMHPDAVLALLRMLGGDTSNVLVVGCEPASVEERMGLSETATAAVDRAAEVVLDLLRQAGRSTGPQSNDIGAGYSSGEGV